MGSSKTAQALTTKFNYEERGMKVWLVKPSTDDRDGRDVVKSRIGLFCPCDSITPTMNLFDTFKGEHSDADVIIVLKDGVIAEAGNHETLIKQGGEYSALYNKQSAGMAT